MYKLCKTEQSALRQRELEMSMAALMKIKRYEEITVSDFCAFAAIPRKAFYRYFSSKDGVLYALMDHTLMEYENNHAPRTQEAYNLQQTLLGFFQFWKGQKLLLDGLAFSDLYAALVKRSVDYVEQESVSRNLLPGETVTSQKLAVRFAMSGLMIMVLQWHRDGFRESVREMADTSARILSTGLEAYVRDLI